MNAGMLRLGFAIFLIAHGLIHMSLTTVPVPQPGALHTPFWPGWWRKDIDSSWLASKLGLPGEVVRMAGSVLWAAALVGYALAGLGLLGLPGLNAIWQASAVGASIASLVLLAFYWHPWLVMGPTIDLAILAGIYLHWPAALFAS